MLRLGFAKGRGAAECMDLLAGSGLCVPEEVRAGRRTVYRVPDRKLVCFVVRGEDLPGLLAAGHLDAAFGSSIVFDERAAHATRVVLPLDIGRCRLSLLTHGPSAPAGRRLCTRYPRVAMWRLGDAAGAWSIRVLHGCVETGLFLGLCDAIVDIVETGWTCRELRLHEQRVLCTVQHQVRVGVDRGDVVHRLREFMPGASWASSDAE
jgi:ATP phosphoribosyltransferase